MPTVAIAGGFDPIHSGHIDHIRQASKLGDVIVIVATDEHLRLKKGYNLLPLTDRIDTLANMKGVVLVVPSIDSDGTVAKTLKILKPDIFAKGGDRTANNMPENEILVCKEIGCKIVYGVGKSLNSSSKIVDRVRRYAPTLGLKL